MDGCIAKLPRLEDKFRWGEGLKEQLVMRIEEGLDWGVCHGDLHGNTNIAFTDNGTLTYYNFEGADFGYLIVI